MKRRTFLAAAGAAAGTAVLGDVATAASRLPVLARPRGSTRAVVIGAGAFGSWAALYLLEAGFDVTLIDAYSPGSARATSGDESRGLRFAYGSRKMYTRLAVEARRYWVERQEEWGVTLALPTGRLTLGPEITNSMRNQAQILSRHGVRHELLDGAEIRRRWPQFGPEKLGGALFEPDAMALRANYTCQTVAKAVERAGGRVLIGRAEAPRGNGTVGEITVDVGGNPTTVAGDVFVYACGPWLKKVFPELLGDKLRVPRRDVLLFGIPAGDPRFSHPNLPNFSESSQSIYGFPDVFGVGLKLAPSGGNEEIDPDLLERQPFEESIRRAREYLALRFPDMADQPLVHYRVCQLEYSPNSHFFIDRHPGTENVWIAGGGSGHAFKHGPALGNYIAQRIQGNDPDPELTGLWKLPV